MSQPRSWRTAVALVLLFVAAGGVLRWWRAVPRAAGPLPQDAYVWQRAWTPEVERAVTEHAGDFGLLVALQAEVTWRASGPEVVRVPLGFAALRGMGRPVGVALRLGPYGGPFAAGDPRTAWLADLAGALVAEAATNGLRVAELQIDFDCAAGKLDGYRVWVEAIRARVNPVPVVITALPSWLGRAACGRLVTAADGWVLQVHSLERPRDIAAPVFLCDPGAARRAVERAARLGRPFRVALPTYGYTVGFDGQGRLVGLAAEGSLRAWPEGVRLRELRADPAALAGLVRDWTADRPAALRGLIWYRLPVPGDRLNWSWPTLAAVMAGREPGGRLRAEVRRPQPGLVEIDLVNDGNADHSGPAGVTVRWSGAQWLAGDAVGGFVLADEGPGRVGFRSTGAVRLQPGARRVLGWLRWDGDVEVHAELGNMER